MNIEYLKNMRSFMAHDVCFPAGLPQALQSCCL